MQDGNNSNKLMQSSVPEIIIMPTSCYILNVMLFFYYMKLLLSGSRGVMGTVGRPPIREELD